MSVAIAAGANIQSAIDAKPAGTIFQLSPGIYRAQQFEAKSGDQLVGDPGGGTILDGAVLLGQWAQTGNNWVSRGLPLQFVDNGQSGSNPLANYDNDLYIDGVLCARVSSLADLQPGKWYFDTSTNSVYISQNPTGHTVEYSDLPYLTTDNGAANVILQNLTVERYASAAQVGAINNLQAATLINVQAEWNHGAGLSLGSGDIVQGGSYSHNGQLGIHGGGVSNIHITGATIASNNYASYSTSWEAGGLKISDSTGVIISKNNVYDNNGHGIWCDIDDYNIQISGNNTSNNNGDGILYEISHGSTSIDGNSVSNNAGSGIYISNSDGVIISHNTVTVGSKNTMLGDGTGGGIDIINNRRGTGPTGVYESRNDTVRYNVVVHPGDSAEDGIFVDQTITNPNNIFNYNTYYVPSATGVYWQFDATNYDWTSLHRYAGYDSSSVMHVGLPLNSPLNTLTIRVSEDAYKGDAKFSVSIDGTQVGGTLTASALHNSGDVNVFVLNGAWGIGSHDVQIKFINDAYDGSALKDRNLYVNSVDYNGVTYSNTTAALWTTSAKDFNIGGSSASGTPPADTLTLHLSEDTYQGDAQFTLSIDGKTITTAQSVTTLHNSGLWQDLTFAGNFGVGSHTIGITFINDAYGGTATADRNLYLGGIDCNGTHFGSGVTELNSNGTASFSITTAH